MISSPDLQPTLSGVRLSTDDSGGQSSDGDVPIGHHVYRHEGDADVSNIIPHTSMHGHGLTDSGTSSSLTAAKQTGETGLEVGSGPPKLRSRSFSADAMTFSILACNGEVAEDQRGVETRADDELLGRRESSVRVGGVEVVQEEDESIPAMNGGAACNLEFHFGPLAKKLIE
jgi:hypothetical protein